MRGMTAIGSPEGAGSYPTQTPGALGHEASRYHRRLPSETTSAVRNIRKRDLYEAGVYFPPYLGSRRFRRKPFFVPLRRPRPKKKSGSFTQPAAIVPILSPETRRIGRDSGSSRYLGETRKREREREGTPEHAEFELREYHPGTGVKSCTPLTQQVSKRLSARDQDTEFKPPSGMERSWYV